MDISSSQLYRSDLYAKKLGFVWRMISFVVLEFGLLVLAGYCLVNPAPVHLPSFILAPQARSVTTTVVVIWRTLAVFPVKDIISSVFSAECAAQYHRTGRLEPDSSDRVSRATSGMVDQVIHFWTRQPTLEYRLAFFLVLLVTVIGPLGPGIVTLSDSPTTCSQDFWVANMSMDNGFASFDQRRISGRAKIVAELELLEGRVYGYDTITDGVLSPWPEPGFERSQNVTMYDSDVVVYNYSCHWPRGFSAVTPVELIGWNFSVVIPGVSPNDTDWVAWDDNEFSGMPSAGTQVLEQGVLSFSVTF